MIEVIQGSRFKLALRSWIGAAAMLVVLAPGLSAQATVTGKRLGKLMPAGCTRIADPKLSGGGVEVSFLLKPVGFSSRVIVDVVAGSTVVATIFDQTITGSTTPQKVAWNGKDAIGSYVDPGDYRVRITAPATMVKPLTYPLSIVRLGITEIEAKPNAGNDEWQMVYFRKGTSYAFYATPAIHEYLNVKDTGEISDLDQNNGSPRPAVAPHTATHEPVMEGINYEDDKYNYPLCYRAGTQPVFELTFGATATSAKGTAIPANYPVPGYEIRAQGSDPAGAWTTASTSITPGGTADFTGPALTPYGTRTDLTITWSWQCRALGATQWQNIAGTFATDHRIYTIVGQPYFATGKTGTQYVGPWVEVAEYMHTWHTALGLAIRNETNMNEAMILGFFGQQGPLTTAIEGVVYDCPIVGGDGGATHYYITSSKIMDLSALLNAHAKGKFVNCSDCSAATTTMISMMGVANVKMLYLGSMTLKAIWGIGCPGYTTNLWGSSHGFSYHHIITRTNGVTVSDACMCLDEDGNPGSTPGIPGYNCDRLWAGTGGYNDLSSYNNVSQTVQILPGLK